MNVIVPSTLMAEVITMIPLEGSKILSWVLHLHHYDHSFHAVRRTGLLRQFHLVEEHSPGRFATPTQDTQIGLLPH